MANEICDQLIDYFNHQLTPEQYDAFENHLLNCEDCRVELKEFERLTDNLPYISNPVDPPEGMKKRILSSVIAENYDKNNSVQEKYYHKRDHASPAKETMLKPQLQQSKQWLKPLMAAALVLSLAGNGGAMIYIATTNTENKVEQTPPGGSNNESLDSIQQTVNLNASSGIEATGTALMIAQNDQMNLVIEADNLPPLEGDQTYQVWVLKDEEPKRAGTFVTTEKGQGAVSYLLDSGQKWDTIAITKEPDAKSQTPKGDILLSSPI